MRRKPHQEYYTPGSGTLRKSNFGNDSNDSDTNRGHTRNNYYRNTSHTDNKLNSEGNLSRRFNEKFENLDVKDGPRRTKKPDMEIYVPRPMAMNKKEPEPRFNEQRRDDNVGEGDRNSSKRSDNNRNERFNGGRTKRYSNRRRVNDEPRDDWGHARQLRQGSEPRGTNYDDSHNWSQRMCRDTRSVEPANPSEKYNSKPPSGRRFSAAGMQEIPPRFRRKMLEEAKLKNNDSWDGSSMTFQAARAPSSSASNLGYATFPARSRGRGRLNYEQSDYGVARSPTNSRPPTPPYGDEFVRPRTPTYRRRDYNRNNDSKYYSESRNSSRERYKDEDNNDNVEDVKPKVEVEEKIEVAPLSPELLAGTTPEVFDWSEEVELNCKLETEETMTRSSSVVSLSESVNAAIPHFNGNSNTSKRSKRRNKGKTRKGRSDSSLRNNSQERKTQEFFNFKTPVERPQRRLHSKDRGAEPLFRRDRSRDGSFDRMRRSSTSEPENWREEMRPPKETAISRSSNRSAASGSGDFSNVDVKKAGVLVLQKNQNNERGGIAPPPSLDNPRYRSETGGTKSLFDPNNPAKPIIVKPSNARMVPGVPEHENTAPPAVYDQYGNVCPPWYREDSEENKASRFPFMIRDVKRADHEIQYAIYSGIFLKNWAAVETFRNFLKESLQYFLCKDLKFSQTGNIEQHFWKLLYYNVIERVRKAIQDDEANKDHYKQFVVYLVDEGTQYFENLLKTLEETYQFSLNNYIGANHKKSLGFVGLALNSAQKIYIFLGDLARYKEQINETSNYGKCRQWYIKAHEINPKNGRPYKQLAVLAICARRKLDAVYYYMRSLMSSNPIHSAREKLTNLFYENSKKYEQGEKKRREERLERMKQHMKEKEKDVGTSTTTTSLRRETWIRPDGGKRVHRTTQAVPDDPDLSENEDLGSLSSVEVNKRFVISYLHVHGKLITKIGMETFQEAAMQMLKEFRALLQHSPLPLPSNRLLQLLALNMFAIETTQLKDPKLQQVTGYRSESQERALVVSLQMFNLILERCVSLLNEHFASRPEHINAVSMDANVLLPPIKIWCDWMLCHSSVWNPPPSTQDFRIGSSEDPWARLATLINQLGRLDRDVASAFRSEQLEGYDILRLPEDNALSGFTPLMLNVDEPTYVPSNCDVETAQFVLRLNKLLFFGTEFLCGLEPPVLKLEIENDCREYVSVVSCSNSRESPQHSDGHTRRIGDDVLTESFSEDDGDEGVDVETDPSRHDSLSEDTSSEVRYLINRKVELEKKHKSHQLHMERVKKILNQSVINVHIDILPKYLVPDTNCFIDHLQEIQKVVNKTSSPYSIMVPIVVLGELEGLSKGGISPVPGTRSSVDPEHVRKVGERAREALAFLKNRQPNVKCVTTKGAVLNSTTFTTEDENCAAKNDDKILNTCLNLSRMHGKEQNSKEGEPRQLFREVVLLTDDRNLRVKALSTDVPVRELPDFMRWAGLG